MSSSITTSSTVTTQVITAVTVHQIASSFVKPPIMVGFTDVVDTGVFVVVLVVGVVVDGDVVVGVDVVVLDVVIDDDIIMLDDGIDDDIIMLDVVIDGDIIMLDVVIDGDIMTLDDGIDDDVIKLDDTVVDVVIMFDGEVMGLELVDVATLVEGIDDDVIDVESEIEADWVWVVDSNEVDRMGMDDVITCIEEELMWIPLEVPFLT